MEKENVITLEFNPSELKFVYECVGIVIKQGLHPRCLKFDYIPEWLFAKLNSEGFACEDPWDSSYVPVRIKWSHENEETSL